MNRHFGVLIKTRENVLKSIKDLSLEQLNHIPDGFNNNIAWNFCHIVVVQKLLTYKLSGLVHNIPAEMVETFKKGSTPTQAISQETIDYFKNQYLTSISLLEEDYKNNKFETFTLYPTSYGFDLHNIDDAILFNCSHEALHLGSIMALKHLV